MNGHILQGTPIAVDYWHLQSCPSYVNLFFLSHLHADHIHGLTSSWRIPIYTSPITAKLLVHFVKVRQDLVKALELHQVHLIRVSEDKGDETVAVTLIDAHHCPGSVMFLFQGCFGNILYTGDFRYEMDIVEQFCLGSCGTIDMLYLDNTYLSPKHDHPSRRLAGDTIVQLIRENPKTMVGIGLRKVGKEDLLIRIAQELDERIVVSGDVYNKMQLLELSDAFTTNEWAGRVKVIPFTMAASTFDHFNNKSIMPGNLPSMVILPTAIFGSIKQASYEQRGTVYRVPYSDHSNFRELWKFVAKVRPRKVIPIVRHFGSTNGVCMSVFDCLLSASPLPVNPTPSMVSQVPRARVLPTCGAVLRRRSRKTSSGLCPKGVQYVDYQSPPHSPLCGDDGDKEVVVLYSSATNLSDGEATTSSISQVIHYSDSSSEENENYNSNSHQTVEVKMEPNIDMQQLLAGEQLEMVQREDLKNGEWNVVSNSVGACKETIQHSAELLRSGNGRKPAHETLKTIPISKMSNVIKDIDCRCLLFWKLDAVIVEALRRGGQNMEPVLIPETHECPFRKLD